MFSDGSSSVVTLLLHISVPCRRFMLNETLFNELVEASRDIPGNRWTVGGNAPVMAERMATEGCDVLLGGSFSPDFTDVLSQHITGLHVSPLNQFSLLPAISGIARMPWFGHHLPLPLQWQAMK